jgi:citronellol/citronellal dehydrogenase
MAFANEFAADGIAANSLWPRTIIATAAVKNLLGGDEAMRRSRRPEILADSAYEIFKRDSRENTGNFYIDDEVLASVGITDLAGYSYGDDAELQIDIFLDE